MVKAFVTGSSICHTTNILNFKLYVVHGTKASFLSFFKPLINWISFDVLILSSLSLFVNTTCEIFLYFQIFILLFLFCQQKDVVKYHHVPFYQILLHCNWCKSKISPTEASLCQKNSYSFHRIFQIIIASFLNSRWTCATKLSVAIKSWWI